MHVLHCVRKRRQKLPFRNSDSSWHFSRPLSLEGGRNIWVFWVERHFEERCGKKTTRFSQIRSLHCTHTIQEQLKKTLQHLSDARCISGETLIFSADRSTSPCSSFPVQFTCCSLLSFSLSLSSPNLSSPVSSLLPYLNFPFASYHFPPPSLFFPTPPAVVILLSFRARSASSAWDRN